MAGPCSIFFRFFSERGSSFRELDIGSDSIALAELKILIAERSGLAQEFARKIDLKIDLVEGHGYQSSSASPAYGGIEVLDDKQLIHASSRVVVHRVPWTRTAAIQHKARTSLTETEWKTEGERRAVEKKKARKKQFPKELLCQLCSRPMRKPMLIKCLGGCGGSACRQCIEDRLRNAPRTCPLCSSVFRMVIRNKRLEEILMKTNFDDFDYPTVDDSKIEGSVDDLVVLDGHGGGLAPDQLSGSVGGQCDSTGRDRGIESSTKEGVRNTGEVQGEKVESKSIDSENQENASAEELSIARENIVAVARDTPYETKLWHEEAGDNVKASLNVSESVDESDIHVTLNLHTTEVNETFVAEGPSDGEEAGIREAMKMDREPSEEADDELGGGSDATTGTCNTPNDPVDNSFDKQAVGLPTLTEKVEKSREQSLLLNRNGQATPSNHRSNGGGRIHSRDEACIRVDSASVSSDVKASLSLPSDQVIQHFVYLLPAANLQSIRENDALFVQTGSRLSEMILSVQQQVEGCCDTTEIKIERNDSSYGTEKGQENGKSVSAESDFGSDQYKGTMSHSKNDTFVVTPCCSVGAGTAFSIPGFLSISAADRLNLSEDEKAERMADRWVGEGGAVGKTLGEVYKINWVEKFPTPAVLPARKQPLAGIFCLSSLTSSSGGSGVDCNATSGSGTCGASNGCSRRHLDNLVEVAVTPSRFDELRKKINEYITFGSRPIDLVNSSNTSNSKGKSSGASIYTNSNMLTSRLSSARQQQSLHYQSIHTRQFRPLHPTHPGTLAQHPLPFHVPTQGTSGAVNHVPSILSASFCSPLLAQSIAYPSLIVSCESLRSGTGGSVSCGGAVTGEVERRAPVWGPPPMGLPIRCRMKSTHGPKEVEDADGALRLDSNCIKSEIPILSPPRRNNPYLGYCALLPLLSRQQFSALRKLQLQATRKLRKLAKGKCVGNDRNENDTISEQPTGGHVTGCVASGISGNNVGEDGAAEDDGEYASTYSDSDDSVEQNCSEEIDSDFDIFSSSSDDAKTEECGEAFCRDSTSSCESDSDMSRLESGRKKRKMFPTEIEDAGSGHIPQQDDASMQFFVDAANQSLDGRRSRCMRHKNVLTPADSLISPIHLGEPACPPGYSNLSSIYQGHLRASGTLAAPPLPPPSSAIPNQFAPFATAALIRPPPPPPPCSSSVAAMNKSSITNDKSMLTRQRKKRQRRSKQSHAANSSKNLVNCIATAVMADVDVPAVPEAESLGARCLISASSPDPLPASGSPSLKVPSSSSDSKFSSLDPHSTSDLLSSSLTSPSDPSLSCGVASSLSLSRSFEATAPLPNLNSASPHSASPFAAPRAISIIPFSTNAVTEENAATFLPQTEPQFDGYHNRGSKSIESIERFEKSGNTDTRDDEMRGQSLQESNKTDPGSNI